ncbi:ABC transporter substrate-binding protein [Arcanobacterium pinnipediorum]|uniref:Thiamine pyrimidine synthase n=1 Tax=Arcanobacterium pinnipediorum TaxID=1503041 RepID=A0ABY5AI54_9ACTO|nr:ABC transporter substrate-binding protein [Arcanobacterium pinnipediorum]USR79675.1 ABC transporter substrate-binding protein [Arcanobacterium pinnipediorum]
MKKFLALCCSFVLAAGLSGCDASTTDDTANRHVRVILDWTPNTNHTGIYVALNKGYYEDAGLDVEVLGFSQAGVESVVEHGGAEFGFTGAESLAIAYGQGADLKMVYSLQPLSSQGIAVRADSDIHTPKDLDGKLFATYGGVQNTDKVKEMIRHDGGKGEFDTVVMGTAAYQAVADGSADFAEGLSTWESIEFELKGSALRFMYPWEWGVPGTPAVLGISAKNDLIKNDPELVKDFVSATKKGYDYTLDHLDEASDILIAENPDAQLNPELVKRSHELLTTKFWPDATGRTGLADLQAWQTFLDYLVAHGTILDANNQPRSAKLLAEDLVTNEFVK